MTNKRSCGGCSECCEIFGVPALGKPELSKCEHQCPAGCAIYTNRPKDCRDFECGWSFGFLSEDQRPDKLGLVFAMAESGERPGRWLHVFETKAGAFDQSNAPRIIRELVRDLMQSGDVGGLEIKLLGQIGIVVHAENLNDMEQLVDENRNRVTGE